MKKYLFSIIFLLVSYVVFSQKGLSYQAVVLDPNAIEVPGQDITGQPLVNGDVWMKFSIYNGSTLQFEEVQKTKTDAYGLVNLMIGSVSTASFNSLTWDGVQKSMQVFVSFNQGASYTKVSDQKLNYNPYALYAETAGKLGSVLSIAGGGTGATTAADARVNLGLGNVDNTSDAAKPISTATKAALDLKANSTDVNAGLVLKANATDVNTALALKANTTDMTAALAAKADTGTIKTFVVTQVAAATIADADASTKGKIKLAGDLAGTADAPTVPGLALKANISDVTTALDIKANAADVTSALALKANANNVVTSLNLKENISNKSTNVSFDGASDTKYPSVKAVKTYVDAQLSGGLGAATISDADANTKGKIQLTGDLSGTAAAPTVPGLALKANTADVTTALALKANSSDVTSALAAKANVSDVSNSLTLKANASDVTTSLNLKANTSDMTSALASKANTSDLSTGLALKINASEKGVANGIATLNSSGIIPSSQLPPVTLSSTNVVASDADMTALSSATVGSIAIRTDLNKNYVLSALPASTLANWVELLTPAAPVQAVNGYTGSINLSKSDIGLNDVDNTSDANKPVSNATQAALDLKLDANKVGVASGVASLNALGKVPTDQIPAISFSSVKVLNSQADMLALSSAVVGSVVIRTDVNKNYVLAAVPASTLGNWIELLTPAPPVQTVNGMSGSVNITKASISLGNVDNTSDANKPISTLTQNALNLKAPLASPTFTGTVTTGVLNTSNINATSINTPIYASTPQTLTDASTINWNPALGLNASVTLGGNRALSFTSTPAAGSYGTLVVTQDATGGRTITLPNTTNKVLKSSSTTSIALSSVPGAKDIINFYYDGTYCYWNIGQGYGVAAVSSAVNTGNLTGTVSVANGGTGASTLTGLVKGNGTSAFTAAVAGTDYQEPLTLTTTGTGAATLSGSILNIPTVASTVNASSISGTVAISNGGTGATTATSALANLTGTQAKNKIFAGPSSSIVTLATYDGSSTSGFTIGSGVTVDNTVGNPSPSIKSVGGGSQYYYKDFGQNFKNKTIEFDIRLTQGTGGIAIGAQSNGSSGVGLVINTGYSTQNGLRTADTWGYPPRGYDTYTFNANTWYSIKIITDNGAAGGVSWYVNGTLIGNSGSTSIGTGTYFGFTADYSGTVVNFDNLTIKDNSGLPATPAFRALVADDIPTLNQNTTGNAATATSATSFTGNLSGDVSGTQSSTVVSKINGTSLAVLSTGLLKNTTSTGVPTIAVAGTDYQAPLTLTTTGTGAATFSGTTLNIPTVASTVNASTISGTVAVANGGTGVTSATGSGSVVLSASPDLTGTPTAPTATAGNNTTQIATTAFVTAAVAAGGGGSTYSIGSNPSLGGYVFYVTPDGKHGLVAETYEFDAQLYLGFDYIKDPAYHSTNGKNFTDWRIPSLYELRLMNAIRTTLSMNQAYYWSSSFGSNTWAYKTRRFGDGGEYEQGSDVTHTIRAIRTF